MSCYEEVKETLRQSPRTWLVTGVAGFIGSNLLELLLQLGQKVVGLDNFVTGHRRNIEDALSGFRARNGHFRSFRFVEGDICDLGTCVDACEGVDYVLHQAALGSVPRSITDPLATHRSNVDGFVNMLIAARDSGVERFVYAASSSTYGDHPGLPKVESRIGRPLSPYAVTKLVDELYADVFGRTYGLKSVGLRYFNVFGRRQDPEGAYAAVIPRWIMSLLAHQTCTINGDGETSRDFCYIEDALQANLLAAVASDNGDSHEVYNVACGGRTTLNQLYHMIRSEVAKHVPEVSGAEPMYHEFRVGDVRHSQADITRIRQRLGYEPSCSLREGLRQTVAWYVGDAGADVAHEPAVEVAIERSA